MSISFARATMLASASILTIAAGGLAPVAAKSKSYAVADVRITQASASIADGRFRCAMTVNNLQDDTAREVTLKIILPIEVVVGAVPSGCEATTFATASSRYTSALTCKIGTLNVGQSASVSLESTVSPHPRSKSCGGFVWSTLPDHDPSNNHKVATAH